MMLPNQDQVTAAIRWIVAVAGAWAMQKGFLDSDQVTMLVGIAASIVPLVWSFIIKTETAKLKAVASVPGVKVVVGPGASDTAKALAADPEVPGVVKLK